MNFKSIKLVAIIGLLAGYPVISCAISSEASTSVSVSHVEATTLGTLMVLNKNEIAAGHLAEKKSNNNDVKEFAAFMIKEHGANLQEAEKLSKELNIKPVKGPVAIKLQKNGKKEAASLKKLNHADFDKAYIQAMVKGHEEALTLVTSLLKNSTNPTITKYLENTKMHVENHLEKATAIQKELK